MPPCSNRTSSGSTFGGIPTTSMSSDGSQFAISTSSARGASSILMAGHWTSNARRDSIWTEEATLIQHSESLLDKPDKINENKCADRIPLSSLAFLGTLGSGGYGKVLLAEYSQNTDRRLCAVKVLHKKKMSVDDAYDLQREIDVLKTVAQEVRMHMEAKQNSGAAFLQRMFSAVQDHARVYITMEYHPVPLSHPDIQSLLRLHPPPTSTALAMSASLPITFPSSLTIHTPYDEVLHILCLLAAELVLGLLFLHERGIVHQDIKPANILVSAAGHVVITDFGSSRMLPVVTTDPWSHSHSRCNRRYGPIVLLPDESVSYTPHYTAPELLGGYPAPPPGETLVYDARVDFYSLGVTLRELATGHAPRLYGAYGGGERDRASEGDVRCTSPSDGYHDGESDFIMFVDALLAVDPEERACGLKVKHHPFFDPLRDFWGEIETLQHPPFLDPPWATPQDDTSFDMDSQSRDCAYQVSSNVKNLFEEAAEIPWADFEPSSSRSGKAGTADPPVMDILQESPRL
ncbi:kinase-like domain-containing protein [Amylocystis lapponica]|nr:kinase-like domain-containing protein [Amylocystis lapponica]